MSGEAFGRERERRWSRIATDGFAIKTLAHPKASVAARRIFQTIIGHHKLEGRPIVYIDESGFAHDMPRTYGYAPVGQRCYGVKDWHAKDARTQSAPDRQGAVNGWTV